MLEERLLGQILVAQILEELNINSRKKVMVNDQITAQKVRLIAPDSEQLGVVDIKEALAKASEYEKDLVEIAPQADPPVCKIMDYGKYVFDLKKKKAEGRKKQKQVHVKEVSFRPTIDIGDFQVKIRKLIKFLENGDKAKVTVRFRGREMMHQDLGLDLIERIKHNLEEHGVVEFEPKLEGRQLIMVFGPKKN